MEGSGSRQKYAARKTFEITSGAITRLSLRLSERLCPTIDA
jgi:hypothetical protein